VLTARIDETATPACSHPSPTGSPGHLHRLVICHPLFGAWTDEDALRDGRSVIAVRSFLRR
jgi:hypothetical protein